MPKRSKPLKTARLDFEQAQWEQGCRWVFGIDEAGRGAWAGPVSAGAVCLSPKAANALTLEGVNDSKQVSAARRERLSLHIQDVIPLWGVGAASAAEIDAMGIVPATCLAMRRALETACAKDAIQPDHLLLDSIRWRDRDIPYQAIVRGDERSLSIAAASILAKVWRDRLMIELDTQYPDYGFARHKGYGTQRHRDAIAQFGATPIHRLSFAPMRQSSFTSPILL